MTLIYTAHTRAEARAELNKDGDLQRTNIFLARSTLAALDVIANAQHTSRSDLIRRIIHERLQAETAEQL